jgi:hypothetical protein
MFYSFLAHKETVAEREAKHKPEEPLALPAPAE